MRVYSLLLQLCAQFVHMRKKYYLNVLMEFSWRMDLSFAEIWVSVFFYILRPAIHRSACFLLLQVRICITWALFIYLGKHAQKITYDGSNPSHEQNFWDS